MTEHLYAYQLAVGSANVLLLNLLEDISHLVHVQLTCQHHHVGKLSIELQSLSVADVELCRQMNLLISRQYDITATSDAMTAEI